MREPPEKYQAFRALFPELATAWDTTRGAEDQGPLDEKTRRLIKLGIAIGSERTGAVRSAVRKAVQAGATRAELLQIIALSASTLGFPGAVAVFSWIEPELPVA